MVQRKTDPQGRFFDLSPLYLVFVFRTPHPYFPIPSSSFLVLFSSEAFEESVLFLSDLFPGGLAQNLFRQWPSHIRSFTICKVIILKRDFFLSLYQNFHTGHLEFQKSMLIFYSKRGGVHNERQNKINSLRLFLS